MDFNVATHKLLSYLGSFIVASLSFSSILVSKQYMLEHSKLHDLNEFYHKPNSRIAHSLGEKDGHGVMTFIHDIKKYSKNVPKKRNDIEKRLSSMQPKVAPFNQELKQYSPPS